MLEHEPLASFHLHAETFEVCPAGMEEWPANREDSPALAERGAMGWFAAV